MELDPRLHSANGNTTGDHGPTSNFNAPSASPADSPSGQLLNSHPRPHGADAADAPSLGLGATQAQQYHDGDEGVDPKRPRACEACRGLKVRCEPDPDDEGPCKRCRKAGRNCVVTIPTRKRQKKTDSRVAELEKKIDALTASLQSRAGPVGGSVSASTSPVVPNRPHVDEPGVLNMAWRNLGGPSWSPSQGTATPSTVDHRERTTSTSHNSAATTTTAGTKRKFAQGHGAEDQQHRSSQQQHSEAQSLDTPSIFARIAQGDVVDRGLITLDRATELFARYNDHMVTHLPAVIFPPGTTVTELRKSKPTLFHSIMAAAASELPILQKVLQKELMAMFAEKIVITGEKNVEIIQALQVSVIWYWAPEHFEELKFYQLVHMAAVMGIDVGLGQRVPLRNRGKLITETFKVNPFRRSLPPDPTTIESRRTWLTCYFLTANTSMALHRPNLVRWNPFMSECIEILETSPDAAPTDKYFCHLIWTHHLSEEVGIQFSLDDPSCPVSITDARTQYALKGLERDLEKYSASIPPEHMLPSLQISFHVLNLYMHEMALHSRSINNAHPANFGPESLRDGLVNQETLSAAHISALSACLTAINGMLTTFLSMDVFDVRCLPVFNFVRVSYALVILIKLYFSASSPDSELGKVINKEDMRVEYFLDALLDKFRATAAEDRSRPAAKFLVVLVMLRSWFYKQVKVEKEDPQQPHPPANHAVSQPPRVSGDGRLESTANTPLQLLSEVAAGSSTANTGPNTSAPTSTTPADTPASRTSFTGWPMRQPPQPFFHDRGPGNSGSTPGTGPGTGSMPPPPPDMSSADLAAAMAPGIPLMANDQGGFTPDLDYGLNAGFDLEAMGLGLGSQDMYENGMRIAMNDPWFSDMFQAMPGGSMFTF